MDFLALLAHLDPVVAPVKLAQLVLLVLLVLQVPLDLLAMEWKCHHSTIKERKPQIRCVTTDLTKL